VRGGSIVSFLPSFDGAVGDGLVVDRPGELDGGRHQRRPAIERLEVIEELDLGVRELRALLLGVVGQRELVRDLVAKHVRRHRDHALVRIEARMDQLRLRIESQVRAASNECCQSDEHAC
jgi:hypothetical protein